MMQSDFKDVRFPVGLGFKASAALSEGGSTIHKKTKDMSGGWRMRVALSKALFLSPSILLLDEPTNVNTRYILLSSR